MMYINNKTASTRIYTISLHDALPISRELAAERDQSPRSTLSVPAEADVARKRVLVPEEPLKRSEEHTSELQSLRHLVCRLLLEKKNTVESIAKQRRKRERGRGQTQPI